MAKGAKDNKAGKATASTPAAAAMVSSIDDIFAKPAKPALAAPSSSSSSSAKRKTASQPVASSSKATAESDQSGDKKKKKKKAKIAASFDPAVDEEQAPASSTPAPRVVEVVDPSLPQPTPAAAPVTTAVTKKGPKRDRKEVEEDEMFRDSRGTGPRRKTEEGFLIYKEAELQIDPEAGGTPLCPFDCDCCF